MMRFPILVCVLIGLPLVARDSPAASSDWAEAPTPAYPLNAAIEGTSGEVKLHVVINNDGRIREAAIVKSSGKKELDYAARAAVLRWRLNKSKIQPADLKIGRNVIIDFRETERERRIATAVLRRASTKGSAWKKGGSFAFPPGAVYPDARRTARIRFTIAPDGHPRTVQIVQSSGSAALDAAAIKGIQTWTAHPEWVGETAEVPVTFEGPNAPAAAKSPAENSDLSKWEVYITYHPKPEYPYEARARYITGSGVYLLTFAHDGHVENVQVLQSTGSDILDSAVRMAFMRWRAVANPPFLQAKIPVTFTMVGAGGPPSRWRLGQPELVGARH